MCHLMVSASSYDLTEGLTMSRSFGDKQPRTAAVWVPTPVAEGLADPDSQRSSGMVVPD